MKRTAVLLTFLLSVLFLAGAQTPFLDEDFIAPPTVKAAWLLDWGGTLSPAGIYDRQGDTEALIAGLSGALWVRLSLPGQWQYYVRLKDNALAALLPWPEAGLELTNLWEVNANYLQFANPDAGLTFSAGRKPFLLGSGLLLSGNGDGAEFQLANPLFMLQAFGFYTGLLNADSSPYGMHDWDDANGAQRYFGGYAAGVGILGHELTLIGLYQGDFGLSPDDLYTSWYTGLQAKGMVADGAYLLEWYLQGGFSPSGAVRGEIDAYGGTCRYQKVFPAAAVPSLTLQYSLASGDADRSVAEGSVGNETGQDTAFQAFGQLNTGSVFRPYFSNIHIVQAGAAVNPLRAASIGLNYFYYAKHESGGVVNGGEAALSAFDLGHGLDLVLRWSPFKDLSVFLNGGVFIPGAAFPQDEALRFTVSGGVSFSF